MIRLPLCAAVITSALFLAGCTGSNPQPDHNPNFVLPMRVAAVGTDVNQVVIAEFVRQDLNYRKFPATLAVHRVLTPENPGHARMSRLDFLRSRKADMVVGCTGELLEKLNPAAARRLMEKYDSVSVNVVDNEQVQLDTYNAVVGALPADVSATDPSPAQACAEAADTGLPQNVVTIFFNETIWRNPRYYLNEDLRTLSTKDLGVMLQKVREGTPVTDIVATYIAGGPDSL